MSHPFLRSALRAFSLAEVLIAIVIITILTIGSLALYGSYMGKARDTERQNDVTRINLFLSQMVAEYGAPPRNKAGARKMPTDCKSSDTNLYTCFKALALSTDDDLKSLLLDPSAGVIIPGSDKPYKYKYGANENSYSICATLEDQASSLMNADASGGKTPAPNVSTNQYCLRYTPPGATEVTSVNAVDDPP